MRDHLARRFFFSSRRRHTRCSRDWSSDVCSSDLLLTGQEFLAGRLEVFHQILHACCQDRTIGRRRALRRQRQSALLVQAYRRNHERTVGNKRNRFWQEVDNRWHEIAWIDKVTWLDVRQRRGWKRLREAQR